MPFLIIFVIVPLMEVYAFITVGEEIGVLQTLLLCVLTAMIGGFLVRKQGLETLFNAQGKMRRGELPVADLFDGFCLIVAGALLLTPGFVTDTVGFLLLIPPLRSRLRSYLAKHKKFTVHTAGQYREARRPHDNGTVDEGVIEGDYETVSKDSGGQNKEKE